MQTAVFSDIHGNCVGLDAVVDDIGRRPVDQVVCLGDVAQGGPQPSRVIHRLQELGCPVVMGNTDAWLLDATALGEEVGQATIEVREWSVSQLSPEQIDFMRSFQPTVEMSLGDGRTFLGFHGSPRSYDEVILPETSEDEFRSMLDGFSASYLAGGHTHLQWIRRLDNSYYFNPGSAGLAYNRHAETETFRFDPWAEYAVVTCDNGVSAVEFRRVPFDLEALVEAFELSDMPYAAGSVARHRPLP